MSLPGQNGRDQLAEVGNESVGALYLLPDLLIRHFGSFRSSSSARRWAMIGNIGWQFKDKGFSLPPQRQIMPADTCGPATEMGQRKPYDIVHKFFMLTYEHGLALLPGDLHLKQLCLMPLQISIGSCPRRLPIFFTQVPDLAAPAIIQEIARTGAPKDPLGCQPRHVLPCHVEVSSQHATINSRGFTFHGTPRPPCC
jgi:hypothetical protein